MRDDIQVQTETENISGTNGKEILLNTVLTGLLPDNEESLRETSRDLPGSTTCARKGARSEVASKHDKTDDTWTS